MSGTRQFVATICRRHFDTSSTFVKLTTTQGESESFLTLYYIPAEYRPVPAHSPILLAHSQIQEPSLHCKPLDLQCKLHSDLLDGAPIGSVFAISGRCHYHGSSPFVKWVCGSAPQPARRVANPDLHNASFLELIRKSKNPRRSLSLLPLLYAAWGKSKVSLNLQLLGAFGPGRHHRSVDFALNLIDLQRRRGSPKDATKPTLSQTRKAAQTARTSS